MHFPDFLVSEFLPAFLFMNFLASSVSSSFRHGGHDDCGDKNVHERDLEKENPAEAHELIVAETGKGPAHPDEEEKEQGHFPEETKDVEESAENAAPAA